MTTFAGSPAFAYEGALTFASVAANTSTTQTVTLPTGVAFPAGVGAGGAIMHLEIPNLQNGLTFSNAQALTSTTFKIAFFNNTGGALTPTGTACKLVLF